ncbi:MAG: Ig domain-containing protein [Gemmatimonadetes bacterium]|nr:Ig domain-containing protein [Gemmatimonadota bacterium]
MVPSRLTRFCVVLGAVFAAACGDDVSIIAPPAEPAIRGIGVAPVNATLKPGETLIMVAQVTADSGADRGVTWSSADPRRATVSANGIVTAVSEGVVIVTATSRARPDISAFATIQVLPAATVRSIGITPATLTLRVGTSVPLVAAVQADSGADRTVLWSSADPSRVSISSTGVVTGLAEGVAVVTATSRARPEVSASSAVTVQPAAGVRSLSVTPASVELQPGAQQALAVNVQADDGVTRSVTYTSNNPAIATVSPAGVVTAVAIGTTTITVSAVASPNVTATAIVSVKSPAPPQVSIQSITKGGTGFPVNLQGAGGQLDVTINVAPGQDPLSTVDLIVNQNGSDILVATQAFLGGGATAGRADAAQASTAPIVLSFRTELYDPETGEVRMKNGPVALRAVAKSVAPGSGTAQSASNTVLLTLFNPDGFHVTMQALSSTSQFNANDANGRAWVQAGRGLVVRSVPVSFSGRVIGLRTIAFPGEAPVANLVSTRTGVSVDTLALNGFSAPTTGEAYLNGQFPAMTAASTLGETIALAGTAGTSGAGVLNAQPQVTSGERLTGLRVDNAPPPSGATFVISTASANSNNWINGTYPFESGLSGLVGDAGVGLAGSNTTPTAASALVEFRITGGALTDTVVATQGSALAATTTHLAYKGVARYADRLGNRREVPLTGSGVNPLATFGVDLVAPTARYLTSPPPGAATIGFSSDSVYTSLTDVGLSPFVFGIEAIDDRSGFGATPVEVTLERHSQPNPSGSFLGTRTCVIGTAVNGTCTAGAVAFAGSPLTDGYRQLTTALDGTTGLEGYYGWVGLVRDQAGNASSVLRKRVLYDQGTGASAPLVATAGAPAFMRGGQAVTFVPVATDNVELTKGQLYVGYPNLPTTTILAYEGGAAGSFAIGTAFDSLLTSPISGGPGFTISHFIRAIESTDVAHAPQAYNAATVKPNATNVVVRDVPNLVPATLAANAVILPGMVETPTGTPGFANLTGQLALLKWRPFTGSGFIRMEAVGPSGQTDSPFARVYLAKLEAGIAPNAQVWRILSEQTAATSQDNGLERVWKYDLGTSLSAGSYIAIGVTDDGDAIVSQVIVI